MLVSTLAPSCTAVTLAPLPRWAISIRPAIARRIKLLQLADDRLTRKSVKALPTHAYVHRPLRKRIPLRNIGH